MKRYSFVFCKGKWRVHDHKLNLKGEGETVNKACLMLKHWQILIEGITNEDLNLPSGLVYNGNVSIKLHEKT